MDTDQRRQGHEDAAKWHEKQARLMRDIVEDVDRGRIRAAGVRDKAALMAVHHVACAVSIRKLPV